MKRFPAPMRERALAWRSLARYESIVLKTRALMKTVFVILLSLVAAFGAFAQGQVNFSGRVVGVYDAPVVLFGGKAAGADYLVQLYAGATANSLAPVGAAVPLRTGAAAGYWTGAARTERKSVV